MDPIRGIVNGLIVSVLAWVLIAAVAWNVLT